MIANWRSFVTSQLHSTAQYVGLDTVQRAHAIIVETWERAEQESRSMGAASTVHWIDVMADKNLETILG